MRRLNNESNAAQSHNAAGKASSFLSGSIWSSVNAVANIAIPFSMFIVFARILPVIDIGLVALAVAWAELGKTIGFTGIYEALIYHKEDVERLEQTASAMMFVLGFVFFLAFCLVVYCARLVVPEIVGHVFALSLLGLRITFELLMQQPQARMARNRDYRRLGLRSVIANLISGFCGVCSSIYLEPLWGLVVYQVLQAGILYAMTVLGGGYFATPRFHFDCWRVLRREASWSSLVRMLAGVNNYLDQILIACIVGGVPLGYFNLVKRIELALVGIGSSFSGVLFQPLFSGEKEGHRGRLIRSSISVVVFACGAPAVIFAVNSRTVIHYAFGERWTSTAGIAGIMALAGFFRALGGVHGALLSVSGRNSALLKSASIVAVVGSVMVVLCLPFGLMACCIAILVKNIAGCIWEAMLTTFEDFRLWQTYALDVALPLLIIGTGAQLGRKIPILITPDFIPQDILHVMLSCSIAAVISGGFFYSRYVIGAIVLRSARVTVPGAVVTAQPCSRSV